MNRFTCPSCGAHYLIVPEGEGKMKRGLFKRRPFRSSTTEFGASKSWQASVAQPVMAPQAVARPPAQHDPAMTRWVRMPLAQARISGFFAAWVPTVIVIGILVWAEAKGWWWATVPGTFIVSALALTGLFWGVLLLIDRTTLLLNEIERFVGIDLNRDGSIGKPPPEPKETVVRFIDEEKRQSKKVPLPVPPSVASEIARAMLKSGGRYNFSRRDMKAKTSISDDQFEKLQRKFLEHGWAVHKVEGKPNTGVVLLAAGRAVLRGYL